MTVITFIHGTDYYSYRPIPLQEAQSADQKELKEEEIGGSILYVFLSNFLLLPVRLWLENACVTPHMAELPLSGPVPWRQLSPAPTKLLPPFVLRTSGLRQFASDASP